MSTRLGDWLDERTGWRDGWRGLFLRNVPRVNWGYTLGSATLFALLNQMFTGILLTVYYVPDVEQAHASVEYITNDVPAGWLIRGLHHWGATAMVVLVLAHMLRVIIYGAYKYPRELTWLTGVVLLVTTLGLGFTGYLLPWDQKAFWATTVGTRIVGAVPLVGDSAMRFLRGGEEITGLTLTRFFGAHVWMLPALLIIVTVVHLLLVVRLGISARPSGDE